MSSRPVTVISPDCGADTMKELVRRDIIATGAVAVGFAEAGEVDPPVMESYRAWIAGGGHAGMDYLARHVMLRPHPRNVLGNVATVISIAYSYAPAVWRDGSLPVVAAYAYGDDYHDVLRARLGPVVESFKTRFGGDWRICIDSAPLAERYWAVKAGIGRRGLNGSVIVDGHGSYVFLVEILTSLHIAPESPAKALCASCGECHRSCPTGALQPDGTIDCRRCLNYLTIEHRGDWDEAGLEAMHTDAGRHTLFGCDICQRVCPHNRDIPPSSIKEFYPRKGMVSGDGATPSFTREEILAMTPETFSKTFKGSPVKRAKLAGLLRNASNLKTT